MNPEKEIPSRLTLAIDATMKLWREGFETLIQESQSRAQFVHTEIESLSINQRAPRFYGTFVPLLETLVAIFVDAYRHFFRMALAHPRECGPDAHAWACGQLQGGLGPVGEWIRDWYALACDGENQYVQRVASIPFVPGETVSASILISSPPSFDAKSWRAPAWLFAVSPVMGFGPLKTKNVPDTDSDRKLSEGHTRLLLKGIRKVFLWKLRRDIETARNEETAAAGAVSSPIVSGERRGPNKREGWQQRLKLYDAIRKVLSAKPDLQGKDFCAELDKRHAPPLYEWVRRKIWQEGLTWKEAWDKTELRDKIRRVRQEAMKIRR